MRAVGRYFAAAWEPRTWLAVAYLLVGLPIAIVLFVYAVTLYSVGVCLLIVWIGVPLLIAVQASMRPLGAFERSMVNGLLHGCVHAAPPIEVAPDAGKWRRVWALFTDGYSWRVLGWIATRIVAAPVGFALAVVQLVLPLSLLASVLYAWMYQAGLVEAWGWQAADGDAKAVVDTVMFWVAVGSPVLLLLIPVPAWAVRGLSFLHVSLADGTLGLCDRDIARAATARAELAEEQVRIDQELHDSIGHMITMNIVQAGAGAHVFDSDPEFARQALRTIEERGRAAMGELDRIIATIRGDVGERAPLPGIADLPALVASAREAGMEVDADLDASPVSPALGRAAFGIVREALTNAARHAPGAAVSVRVSQCDDALVIDVANAKGGVAPASPEHRPRHGVSGMRDRVTLLGGRTEIGPTADGGYRVLASLPFEPGLRPQPAPWDDAREGVRT